MGSTAASALLLLLLTAVAPAVLAVTLRVGGNAGWAKGVDYTKWVTGKTFRVGDTLEFRYGPLDSVFVVDKAGFDGCDSTGSTQSFSGGDTKIYLTTVETIHFISPTPGGCAGGMKLAVPVLAAASSPANPSALYQESPPLSPKTPSPSASPTANGKPVRKLFFFFARGRVSDRVVFALPPGGSRHLRRHHHHRLRHKVGVDSRV